MPIKEYREEAEFFDNLAIEYGKLREESLGFAREADEGHMADWCRRVDDITEASGEYDLTWALKEKLTALKSTATVSDEITARLRAIEEIRKVLRQYKNNLKVMRRAHENGAESYFIGEYEITPIRDIRINGVSLKLTPQLHRLLFAFLDDDHHTLNIQNIMRAIWDGDALEYNRAKVPDKISRLRKILRDFHDRRDVIELLQGNTDSYALLLDD